MFIFTSGQVICIIMREHMISNNNSNLISSPEVTEFHNDFTYSRDVSLL